MNALKTGAVALMLIIVIPILLGFGMATHDEEITVDKTTEGGSLTDLVLNSQSPYFASYPGVNNNSTLIKERLINVDEYETSIETPDYNEVGETYTTQQIMVSGSSTDNPTLTPTLSLNPSTTQSLSGGTSHTFSGHDYSDAVTLSGASGALYVYGGYSSLSGADETNTLVPDSYNEIVFPTGFYVYDSTDEDSTPIATGSAGTVTVYKTGAFLGTNPQLKLVMPDSTTYTGYYFIFDWNPLYTIEMYSGGYNSIGVVADYWFAENIHDAPLIIKDYGSNTPKPFMSGYGDIYYFAGSGHYDTGDGTEVSFTQTSRPTFASGYSANFSYTVPNVYTTENLPDFDIAYVSSADAIILAPDNFNRYQIVETLSGSGVYIIRDGNNWIVDGQTYGDFKIIPIGSQVSFVYSTVATLSPQYDGDDVDVWAVDTNGVACVRLTYNNGNVEYIGIEQLNSITYTYGLVVLNTSDGVESRTGVAAVGIVQSAATTSLDWTFQTPSGDYADISYGWQIPSSTGVVYWRWVNGYSNDYVRLMVKVDTGEQFSICDENDSDDTIVNVINSSGVVTVTIDGSSTVLGTYTYLMVELDSTADLVSVSGLLGWDSITENPQANNVVSESFDLDNFSGFYLKDISGDVDYRVDSTRIQAGFFPSTVDRHLKIYDYYPNDDNQSIVIDSVGVYGDYLTIGGVPRPVTNGTIVIPDVDTGETFTISVLDAVITYNYTGDEYITYVNGHRVANGQSAPELIFGGEWVLTLHRTTTVTETSIQNNWNPGGFAFDQDDFLLCMILTTVGVFIALGLMKGVRIGVLAVVCGAAGIIAFIIA